MVANEPTIAAYLLVPVFHPPYFRKVLFDKLSLNNTKTAPQTIKSNISSLPFSHHSYCCTYL